MSARRRLRRRQLDGLIEAYQSQNPGFDVRLELTLTPTELRRLVGQAPWPGSATEFSYRGVTLVASASDPPTA